MSFPPKAINDRDFNRLVTKTFGAMQWYGSTAGGALSRGAMRLGFELFTDNVSDDTYGTEVEVHDGTVIETGDPTKLFSIDGLSITSMSASSGHKIELWYGTTNFAGATLWTESEIAINTVGYAPEYVSITTEPIPCNHKVWARIGGPGGAESLVIWLGIHVYDM